jgi:sarcosine oxidase subunit beta
MSGHGFMMSPAVGEAVATIVAEQTPKIDVSSLNYRRFKNNQLIFEPSVV